MLPSVVRRNRGGDNLGPAGCVINVEPEVSINDIDVELFAATTRAFANDGRAVHLLGRPVDPSLQRECRIGTGKVDRSSADAADVAVRAGTDSSGFVRVDHRESGHTERDASVFTVVTAPVIVRDGPIGFTQPPIRNRIVRQRDRRVAAGYW